MTDEIPPAALPAPQQGRPDTAWRSMNSAPLDFTPVLLSWQPPAMFKGHQPQPSVVLARWACRTHGMLSRACNCPNDDGCIMGWDSYAGEMLAWMPLPEPLQPLQTFAPGRPAQEEPTEVAQAREEPPTNNDVSDLWVLERQILPNQFGLKRAALERIIALLKAASPSPQFDPANHHNTLACPYCNPKGLTFASPSQEGPTASSRTLIELDRIAAEPSLRQHGWDTYGSEPLDDRAIAAARTFLRYPWNVVPCPGGGIQLEMHASGFDIELEFAADGSVESAYAEVASSQASEGEGEPTC